MKKGLKLLLSMLLLGAVSCGNREAAIYVSPSNGSDSNVGTIDSPLATIEAARDMIRSMDERERQRNITVYLRGGEYRLSRTLRFGVEDSAPDGYTYIYKAYPDETPTISSDIKVNSWREATDLPAALQSAKGKIYVTRIPEGLGRVYNIYNNGERIDRSHREGFQIKPLDPIPLERHKTTKIDNVTNYKSSRSMNVYYDKDRYLLTQFNYDDPEGLLSNLVNIDEVEVGFAPVPWVMNLLPLKSIDTKRKIVYTTLEANAPAGSKLSHTKPWVENVLEYLTEGRFATLKGEIYYYPAQGERLDNIVAPRLIEYLLVEGNINYDGAEDQPVKNLAFEGLKFTRAGRYTWGADHKGWGIQHDWDKFDAPNAMVRLRGAEGCRISECHFTQSANSAIRLDLHAQRNTIDRNLINYVGHMGILLCGYGPGTKDVNRGNTITNNLIHHVGEVVPHGAGIFVWQSGENLISHNLIHHVPRKGVGLCGVRTPIMVKEWCDFDEASKTIRRHEISAEDLANYKSGKITLGEYWLTTLKYLHARNNIVEYNEVYRALEALGDGSVLNVSGAGEGNIVRNNYVHHIASHASGVLRTDDWQRGTTFEKNIINMSNVAAIVHKGYNHILNNYIVDCSVAESIRWASYPDEEADYGSEVKRNIFYESGARLNLYRESYRASEGISLPHNCKTDNNLIWIAKSRAAAEKHITKNAEGGVDQNSVIADPMFEDAAKAQFTLAADSPAKSLGIEAIDLSEIGLTADYPERYRALDYADDHSGVNLHRNRKKSEIYDFW
ncbi:MAG: right-handed parallel beta-helix repeat-containing protein [Rikenellaceae bacterium]